MIKSRNDASISVESYQKNTDEQCGKDEYWRYGSIPGHLSETISYETPRFKRYGNCRHVKTIRNYMSGHYYGTNNTVHSGHTFETSDRRIWGSEIDNWESYPIFAIDKDALNAEAYLAMKPSLSSGFSLSNFVIELAEFKWIYKAFKKANQTFSLLKGAIGFTDGDSLTSNVASAYLMYQFGWKLFVKDLMELYGLLANMEKTLRDYASRQNIPQVRHFKKTVYSGTTGGESAGSFRRTYKYDCTFYATMKYIYRVQGIHAEYAKLKGILDILGLKANVAVVWNAIPFSFVVDWFLNVGDVLDAKFNKDYLESEVTILDYCFSTKQRLVTEAWIGGPNTPEGFLGTVEKTTYERRRSLPKADDFGLKLSDRYGSKQMLLSAALVLA